MTLRREDVVGKSVTRLTRPPVCSKRNMMTANSSGARPQSPVPLRALQSDPLSIRGSNLRMALEPEVWREKYRRFSCSNGTSSLGALNNSGIAGTIQSAGSVVDQQRPPESMWRTDSLSLAVIEESPLMAKPCRFSLAPRFYILLPKLNRTQMQTLGARLKRQG